MARVKGRSGFMRHRAHCQIKMGGAVASDHEEQPHVYLRDSKILPSS